MSERDVLTFGIPWAADGETRSRHFRTLLAHAPGLEGGMVLVLSGRDPEHERWVRVSDWQAWIASVHAAPVVEPEPEMLFDAGGDDE